MPAWRLGLVALVVGTGVALVLTHPLVLHPATTVLDDGTLDCFQFIWNVWWLRTSVVDLHTNPFFTRHLYYPDGISLLFHTLSASLGFLSIPLQLVLPNGHVTAHNLLVIVAPALILATTALLAHEVTGDVWAALAAGCMATVTGAVIWFLPIIYLTATYLVGALVWAWWRMHRLRRARDVVLLLALLAVLVFASPEYAVMALLILAGDGAVRLVTPRTFGLPAGWWRGTLVSGGVAAAGLAALALVASRNPGMPPPVKQLLLGSAYLSAFVAPPWLVPPQVAFGMVMYLGTVPVLLVAATAWLGGRRAAFWALVTAGLLLMACGPFVGFSQPLQAFGPVAPETLREAPPGHVRGPYWLALKVVPFLRVFRGASRWVTGAEIAFAVLAATGIAGLRARLDGRRGRAVVGPVVIAAALVIGFLEIRGHENRIVPTTLPAAYATVQEDREPAAILELPTGLTQAVFMNLGSRYMLYQTWHRKLLLEGTVARLPPGRRQLVSRRFTTFTELPWIKYVVLHRDLLDVAFPVAREQLAQVETILATEGTLLVRDGPLEIYRLATFRPETVR